MKWKVRIVQCRQRTRRLIDVIHLKKISHRRDWNKTSTWEWRLKYLMNVRAYLWSPYEVNPPWTYDQDEVHAKEVPTNELLDQEEVPEQEEKPDIISQV